MQNLGSHSPQLEFSERANPVAGHHDQVYVVLLGKIRDQASWVPDLCRFVVQFDLYIGSPLRWSMQAVFHSHVTGICWMYRTSKELLLREETQVVPDRTRQTA